jgi:hypothetical protein
VVRLQGANAEDAENYAPFQFMLQFMLQPLLAASAATPAGHMAPVLLKMCRTLKRTADAAVSIDTQHACSAGLPQCIQKYMNVSKLRSACQSLCWCEDAAVAGMCADLSINQCYICSNEIHREFMPC